MARESTIYEMALSNLRAELHGMAEEFDRLSKRKSQLEAAIANLTPLVEPKRSLSPIVSESATTADGKVPIWKSITLAINGKGTGFTVKDALIALDRMGRPVKSKNKVQIVRNALMKSPAFERISPGVFSLIESPEDVGIDQEAEAI